MDIGSLDIIRIPLTGGLAGYTLVEADGAAARAWRSSLVKVKKYHRGKPVDFDTSGLADADTLLVSLCLLDPEGKPVPHETVKGWPARVIKPLFEKVKEISELNEKDDSGNEQEP